MSAARATRDATRRGDGVERRHAIVVGIDRYIDSTGLPFCAADAQRVAAVLRARGYRVTILHDGPGRAPRPTLARVNAAIAKVVAAADEDDLVVAHFSCHGLRVHDRAYLMMADTPSDAIEARGLALADLLAGLRGGSRWTGVFLDVCHMGLGLDPGADESIDDGIERGGGFALLAGSTSAQIAQDTEDAGIFTRCLVDGLAGAAADPDGGVRFSVLARHVQDGVERWRTSGEGKLKTSKQRPVLRLEVADLHLAPPTVHRDLAPASAAKVTCVAFSPDGRRIAAGAADHAVRLWDARRGQPIGEPMTHDDAICDLGFAADGRHLYSASDDGVLGRWDAVRGRPARPRPAPIGGSVSAVAWWPRRGGGVVAAGTDIHVAGVTDVDPTQRISRLRAARLVKRAVVTQRIWLRDRTGARTLDSGDGAILDLVCSVAPGWFISGGADGAIRLWNGRNGTGPVIGQHDGPVWALALSPDGHAVAAGGSDALPSSTLRNEVRLWDLVGEAHRTLRGHPAAVTSIAYAPDGLRLATGCQDGVVRLWDAGTGQLLRRLTVAIDGRVHHAEVLAIAFSPVGRRLVAGYADGRVRIFELEA